VARNWSVNGSGRRSWRVIMALALSGCVTAGVAGCAVDGDSVGTIALAIGGTRAPGSPVDVYTRVARGAKACWFGEGKPLATGYVFAADVRPEEKGGAAEITIFEAAPENKRGLRAFTVTIVKSKDGTADQSMVGPANARLPEAVGDRMRDDTLRWASGESSCAAADGVWSPQPEAEPAAPAKPAAKSKLKKPVKT
jgi:hypothetical protein